MLLCGLVCCPLTTGAAEDLVVCVSAIWTSAFVMGLFLILTSYARKAKVVAPSDLNPNPKCRLVRFLCRWQGHPLPPSLVAFLPLPASCLHPASHSGTGLHQLRAAGWYPSFSGLYLWPHSPVWESGVQVLRRVSIAWWCSKSKSYGNRASGDWARKRVRLRAERCSALNCSHGKRPSAHR